MSKETKSDQGQDTLEDTRDRWEKNVADHHRLELQLVSLEGKMDGVRGEMDGIRGEMDGMRGQMTSMQGQIGGMQGQIGGMQGQINGMQGQINGLRSEVVALSDKMERLFKEQNDRIDKQRRDDRWLMFSIIGLFLTLLTIVLGTPVLSKILQLL